MLRVYCSWPGVSATMNERVGRGEEAIGDVDGDALLALGLQAVDQQREIDVLAGGAVARGILRQRRELVVEDQLANRAAGGRSASICRRRREPQVMKRKQVLVGWPVSRSLLRRRGVASEIAFALLLLHRGRFVAVDQPALPLGDAGGHHLGDDVVERVPRRIRSRRSADSSPACGSAPARVSGLLAGLERHALVVDHDPGAVALAPPGAPWRNRAARPECSPRMMYCQTSSSVQFDSGKTRIDSPWLMPGVEQVPQFRPLVARVPAMILASGTRRCAPWRGSFPRRGARRRRRRRSRICRAPASALRSS